MNDQLSPLIDAIERHESFLLLSHIDPDGDAIGALIALLLLLERKGKRAVAYDRDGVPRIYRFLRGSNRILSTPPSSDTFDVAIFLECPNTGRAGAECGQVIKSIPLWVNLDHHADNAGYGHVNIIRPELSAVSEIIYMVYELMDEPLDAVVATALYTGIMTDTGSYKYSNTSPECHVISARLLEFGIKPYEIYQEVYEKLSVPAALIAARAHGTLEVEDGISCITVTRRMLEETGATPEDTHDVVSYGRAIENVEVALLFRETENDIKVSLRSTQRINVNKIAVGFNGGGHLRAAGCNIKGTMEEVKAKVFAAVRQALAEAGDAQQTNE
jgi:phosphoesterase RecJ-like protein